MAFPRQITCIHQGSELYGSDRTFLLSMKSFRHYFSGSQINVIIPKDGELAPHLRVEGQNLIIDDIWILRRVDFIKEITCKPIRKIKNLFRAARHIYGSDFIYINTSVVFDYIFMSRFFPKKNIICHIHEIPLGFSLFFFRLLILWSRTKVIFNSHSTAKAFSLPATQKSFVLLNACRDPTVIPLSDDDGRRPLRVLMLGRINNWKGQDLLVEAVQDVLPSLNNQIDVRIIGGTFGSSERLDTLRAKIHQANLDGIIRIEPFLNDPSPAYAWADVVVVPSRKPEPFGLVAIEALAHGRPVIAANHGGLSEIIVHGESGWLFEPNNREALGELLIVARSDRSALAKMGEKGRRIYESKFTEQAYENNLIEIINAVSLETSSFRDTPGRVAEVSNNTILCVHQGHELYGSDRSFVRSVSILSKLFHNSDIAVFLPKDGPIVNHLTVLPVNIKFGNMWVIRHTDIITDVTFKLFKTIHAIIYASRAIKSSKVVYINTAVVASYYIAAGFLRKHKVVCHVREIPLGLSLMAVRALVRWSGATVIFNSEATAKAFSLPKSQRSFVLMNACDGPAIVPPYEYHGQRPLRVLMLGRINNWKGQDLLVDSLQGIMPTMPGQISVKIIGGTFGSTKPLDDLMEKIRRSGFQDIFSVEPFCDDPSSAFLWSDVVVVPSRKPEPFGLVAVEAMAYGRPVIAANHGGLSEIVTPDLTGWLFRPNDTNELGGLLKRGRQNPEKLREMGAAGRSIFEKRFSHKVYEANFTNIFRQIA